MWVVRDGQLQDKFKRASNMHTDSMLYEYTDCDVILNIQDQRTAVFYAAEPGCINIVQLLIEHGIDLKLKDKVHNQWYYIWVGTIL